MAQSRRAFAGALKKVTEPAGAATPDGATPLDEDELEGLIPSHIATQQQLNEWEQTNILAALRWAQPTRRREPKSVLTMDFAEELHRRMFDQTWKWAGKFKRTLKNIGVPPEIARLSLRERLADAAYWHDAQSFSPDEIAARLHHAAVSVHPWPNGNGRWSRQLADSYLHAKRCALFTWGGEGDLGAVSDLRRDYLTALRAADNGNFTPLLQFVRR